MPRLLATAVDWMHAGRQPVLAWVVDTWGSAPNPVGSRLLVAADGAMEGLVSGGCVEGAVVEAARVVCESRRPQVLDFAVSDERALSVGLSCGGQIRILVDAVDAHRCTLYEQILDRLARRRATVLHIDLATGTHTLAPDPGQRPGASKAQGLRLQFDPSLRLLIVGAVHIAQELAPMAGRLGYEVLVDDPRRAFATAERFPGVTLSHDWPDAFLARLAPDHRDAVVVLSHDPKIDDRALVAALAGTPFYVGALGSRRTHAQRLARLREAGLGNEALERIHGPVGLDIGARSPAEIALATLAQMTACRRRIESETP